MGRGRAGRRNINSIFPPRRLRGHERTKMKKWAIIDNQISNCAVEYTTVCESKEDAVKKAEYEWSMKSDYDKKRTDFFIVGLIEVDEENERIDDDVIEIVKDYKAEEIRYYVLFSDDGSSAEGDFEYHDTLEDAINAAQEILEADPDRSADEYYISAANFDQDLASYDIYGNEL